MPSAWSVFGCGLSSPSRTEDSTSLTFFSFSTRTWRKRIFGPSFVCAKPVVTARSNDRQKTVPQPIIFDCGLNIINFVFTTDLKLTGSRQYQTVEPAAAQGCHRDPEKSAAGNWCI